MDLENPDKTDLVLGRFFLSLKLALESKHQLLPYLRQQIMDDISVHYAQLDDDSVKNYLKSLK